MQINEVGILLIRLSPVKKFWTLDTPKETGSIGSTQRRVETLWRSIVTCQDMVVSEWIVFLRHEDFNMSIFDLVELLLERSGLGYSCFLNNNRTVYASYLWLDGVIEPLKGQLTRHACASGQNASCARCWLAFRGVNCCFSFLWKRITDV